MRLIGLLALVAVGCSAKDDDDTDDTGETDTEDTDTDSDSDSDSDTTEPSVADLLARGDTVQEILDAGHTPLEIYQADASKLDTIYGSLYQGGYIFYLDTTDGSGLVSDPGATRDSPPWNGLTWGCTSTEITGADGTAVGTGAQNTADLTSGCADSSHAAKACADLVLGGYDDWFLPSRDELVLMYTNLKDNGNQGNLHANDYWSSTEFSASSAYYVFFATGQAGQDAKTVPNRIRAVRAF